MNHVIIMIFQSVIFLMLWKCSSLIGKRMQHVLSSSRGWKHTVPSHNSFSHLPRDTGWLDLKVITCLMQRMQHLCASVLKRMTQWQCFMLNLRWVTEPRNQRPAFRYCERKKRDIWHLRLFALVLQVQVGAQRDVLSRLRNIFLYVRSPCVTLFSHHFLPGRWTTDVIFNPQTLLTLQYPALATQA